MGRPLDWLCADEPAALALPLDRGSTLRGPAGVMRLQRHDFASGLRLFDARIQSLRSLQVRPQVAHDTPFVGAHVTLAGRSLVRFADGVQSEISTACGSFFRPRGQDSLFEVDEAQILHQIGIAADLPMLAHWFGPRLPASLRPYLQDRARISRVAALPVPAARIAASGLLHLPYRGDLRAMMLEGIAMQMMAAFLDALCGSETDQAAISERERRAALEARARLLEDMRMPPGAGELALAVGLSARRLELVFHALFGGSVFAVLRRERLEQAMIALRTENIPVKTIAWRVGYDHVANFSRAFREHFGVAPSAVRGRRG